MSLDVIKWLQSPSFDRSLCLEQLQKRRPFYFDQTYYSAFADVCRSVCRDHDGQVLFEVDAANGAIIKFYSPDPAATLHDVLWGEHSGWYKNPEFRTEHVPSFIRRAVELALGAQAYPSRLAVQCLVDMGHFRDYGPASQTPVPQIQIDAAYPTFGMHAFSAACLSVSAWLRMTQYDASIEHEHVVKENYMKIRDGLQNAADGELDAIVQEIRDIIRGDVNRTDAGRVFMDSLTFFRGLSVTANDHVQHAFHLAPDGVLCLFQKDIHITHQVWCETIGNIPRDCITKDGLVIPEEIAIRVRRYLVPYIAADGKSQTHAPLYPMITRSYLQALNDNDHRGMTLIVRAMISLITSDYPRIVVTERTFPAYSLLPMLLDSFGVDLWTHLVRPYACSQNMEFRTSIRKGVRLEKVIGFGE